MNAVDWFERYPDLGARPLFTLRLTVSGGRVTIRAFEGPHSDPNHTTLFCELWTGSVSGQKRPLFNREQFTVGIPGHACIDSEYAKSTVLSLFAMKPGDTDDDFFADYSEAQLAFVEAHSEEISLIALDRYGEL
jgi:hypothetical protein